MKQTLERNKTIYERRSIVLQYATSTGLTEAEQQLLARYHADIVGGRVLDLGVGAGRTTPYLADLAEVLRGRGFQRGHGDSLPTATSSTSVSPGGRTRPVGISRRPLRCRSLLHSTGSTMLDTMTVPACCSRLPVSSKRVGCSYSVATTWQPSPALAIYARRSALTCHGIRYIPPKLSSAPVGAFTITPGTPRRSSVQADYAILTDPAHGFVLRTYYVTADAQRRQLVAAGFSSLVDIEPGTDEAIPYYLYYAARKNARGDYGSAGR